MRQLEVIRLFTDPLERAGFPYMITGSVAAIIYGMPRLTHDVDLIIDVPAEKAEAFAALFPDADFYCPPLEVLSAELKRAVHPHLNLIHHQTGFKADIYPSRDWLQRWGMERRKRLDWNGSPISVAPPEYVVVRKLDYFTEGGSEKHLTDIRNMLAVQGDGMDLDWIRARVEERGLEIGWRRVNPP